MEPQLMLVSTPARLPLLSRRWTRTARIFLTAELRVVLKLLERTRASTLKSQLLLPPWRQLKLLLQLVKTLKWNIPDLTCELLLYFRKK